MSAILCPHCEKLSCAGRCRFQVRRRSFLALGLGALAAAVLPAPEVVWYHVPEVRLITLSDELLRDSAIDLRAHIARAFNVPAHLLTSGAR